MSENTKPNLLKEEYTSENVNWYDNQMPVEAAITQYLIIEGERHEIEELNSADWLILNALCPNGPQKLM